MLYFIFKYLIVCYHLDMGRKPRILKSGGWYHVYNRANNRRRVHFSESMHGYFLSLLQGVKHDFGIETHAYCLMQNHYHLLLRTPEPNLSEGMKQFGERLARQINFETNGVGPVFQSRYKAKLILEDSYLMQVFRYIHLNPVEAGMVSDVGEYDWSSYAWFLQDGFSGPIITDFFKDKFFSEEEFFAYHDMGNSKQFKRLYLKKVMPSAISSDSLGYNSSNIGIG